VLPLQEGLHSTSLTGSTTNHRTPELKVKVTVEEDDHQLFNEMREKSIALWTHVLECDDGKPLPSQIIHAVAQCEQDINLEDNASGHWIAKKLQQFVMPPSAGKRLFWDFAALLTVVYDAFMIPIANVFDIEMSLPMFSVSCFIALFWTADMVGTFFTGVHNDGFVEMRIGHIATRYLKSWFLLDISIVTLDWVFIAMWVMEHATTASRGSKMLRFSKSVRALRSLRLISLARIGRATTIVEEMARMSHHELTASIVRLVESLCFVLMSTHFVACAWYALGKASVGEIDNWLEFRDLEDAEHVYCYFTSFHWALTQFTPASMDVQPVNSGERIFTVFVDLFGLVAFSTFVSTITTRMTQLRSFNKTRTAQIQVLRDYFYENGISLELTYRIMQFIRTSKNFLTSRTSTSGIELLRDIPESLRLDLNREVFLPIVGNHPMIHHLAFLDIHCATEICSKAVKELALVKDSELFSRGDVAECMYFLHTGQMRYHRAGASSILSKGNWVSEAAVWIGGWVHRGDLLTSVRTDIIGLQSEELRRIFDASMLTHGLGAKLAYRYATKFVRDECDYDVELMLRCTDIWGDAEHIRSILFRVVDYARHTTRQRKSLQAGLAHTSQHIMSMLRRRLSTTG